MVSISGISTLGVVTSENVSLESNLFKAPLPGGKTENNSVINLLGKVKKVGLRGRLEGSTVGIGAFITNMLAWLNTNFQESRVYTGSFETLNNVLCESFTYEYSEGNPNHITYEIQLVQGNLTAGLI